MNPLLLLAVLLPGLPADAIPDIVFDGDRIVVDETIGTGATVNAGRLATLSLDIDVVAGKHLFDTEKRGLPYTIRFGDTATESMLSTWIEGMRLGGSRSVYTLSAHDDDSLVPRSTPLAIHLRLLDVSG